MEVEEEGGKEVVLMFPAMRTRIVVSRNEDSQSEKSQTGEPEWHDVCNDRHRSAERRYQAT